MARMLSAPSLRILATAAFAVLFLTMFGCDQRANLLTHVDTEKEAIEILNLLNDQGINARKHETKGNNRSTRWVITLPNASPTDEANALRLLANENLPRTSHNDIAKFYGSPSMLRSKKEEHARYMAAKEGEIEKQLECITGITRADVNLTTSVEKPLSAEDPKQPTASVVINYQPDVVLNVWPGGLVNENDHDQAKQQTAVMELIDQVKNCVAHSLDGLNTERVIVCATPAKTWQLKTPPQDAINASAQNGNDEEQAAIQLFPRELNGTIIAMAGIIVLLLILLLWGKGQSTPPPIPSDQNAPLTGHTAID